MPKFNYVAMDTKGKEITGVLESDNTTTAVSRIREMGYFPTNITEVGKDKKPGKKTPAAPGAVSAPKPAAKKGGGGSPGGLPPSPTIRPACEASPEDKARDRAGIGQEARTRSCRLPGRIRTPP